MKISVRHESLKGNLRLKYCVFCSTGGHFKAALTEGSPSYSSIKLFEGKITMLTEEMGGNMLTGPVLGGKMPLVY